MEMNLIGIENKNEYYTSHYFTSIFKDNAEETISDWRSRAKEEGIDLPWHRFRDIRRQYSPAQEKYNYFRSEEQSKPLVQEMAELYLNALGYEKRRSVSADLSDGLSIPVYHEEAKANGAPLLWAFLCVNEEHDGDILRGHIFEKSEDEDITGASIEMANEDLMAKIFFAGEEVPRFVILIGINQIALIDRNKWNEKRFLQFDLNEIFGRHEESTYMAMIVLLHRESLCPADGGCVLDTLDENSNKHSAGVSEALKFALRECIEILGNEVIYDLKTRQGINLEEKPVDPGELTLQCLRYMYRFLFMLFIESRSELGYAPMKSETYVKGYSLEGLRDVCARVKDAGEVVSEGYYIDDTISELFHMIYMGYPEDLDEYKKAVAEESLHDVFTIEALKAHIFDPEYTKLITEAKLRNSAMLQIVDLMSISRPSGSRERRGRISYSALGINQMGAVYEALLSYRGFIAEQDLYEVKRAGDKFSELDVGYFVPESELSNYDEETERVRYEHGEKKGQLRMYEKGTFIYRLAGREREKSASYYTPEVLTKCLVKYALKELLRDKTADQILDLTICEPAMGSAAFLNEAINQIAEAYLQKKQEETGLTIEYEKRFEKLQQVKMYIADRNVYGVDLNPIAVELAEVSLWLNTIYKGAFVPWFGTQLVCGNSLIGARRQVYYVSKLEVGKWYDEAPVRIMPGEKRKRTGVSTRIYHFLLGDPGMSNYTDKVIKGLEPENIKKINNWRKEFTKKYDEDDLVTLQRLSDAIDTLWDKTVELRKSVEKATAEPLSVFGHEETGEGSHTTIREKDAIYHKLFKSENMNNAGPYARLKAAMDYWCALWFWPIDKADLLPSRQEFFFEMSLMLEGGLQAVNVNTSNQMTIDFEATQEVGILQLIPEGDQFALEFNRQYSDLPVVCLDDLRERSERLAIANQIAEQQHFMHWELEFADVFAEKGGFDLVVGNPPWIKMTWNEQNILSESNPLLAIRKISAAEIAKIRTKELDDDKTYKSYIQEYRSVSAMQNYMDSHQNYYELSGQQTNLYKCFIPKAFYLSNNNGVNGLLHPDSVFDDPKGDFLRKEIYRRLRKHFQFMNMLKLFPDVHSNVVYSINIYSNVFTENFEMICNLYWPSAIDESYDRSLEIPLEGLRDFNDNWSRHGNPERILNIGERELKMFMKLFGGVAYSSAKISPIHTKNFVEILSKISNVEKRLCDLEKHFYTTELWHETNDVKKGIISLHEHFPESMDVCIYSSPHIANGNPIYKTTRTQYTSNSSYDNIDLMCMEPNYIQRCLFEPTDFKVYNQAIPICPWGKKYNNTYKLVTRKMLNLTQERTMMATIIPQEATHTFGLFGVAFEDIKQLSLFSGVCMSLVGDFLIKIMGKSNTTMDNFGKLPILNPDNILSSLIIHRVMLLNCITQYFSDIWEINYDDKFVLDSFAKDDPRLNANLYKSASKTWMPTSFARDDYERRQLLVEIDVLVAMSIGITLEELKEIYDIQFPVVKKYENETWFDKNGRIIFSSKAMGNLTIDRKQFEEVMSMQEGEVKKEIDDDTTNKGVIKREIIYVAPFDRCNREEDYETAWRFFEEKYGKVN